MKTPLTYASQQVDSGVTESTLKQLILGLPPNEHRSVLLGTDAMYGRYDALLAWGARALVSSARQLQSGWWFGHITYDAHELWSDLRSRHQPIIGFSAMAFFAPRFLLTLKKGCVTLHYAPDEEAEALRWWNAVQQTSDLSGMHSQIDLAPCMSRADYLEATHTLRDHLKRGDVYEVNYCQYFSGETTLHPLRDFVRWMTRTSAPFSAYYQFDETHLLCASPERYLCKRGTAIYAQPIKGTSPRHPDPLIDQQRKDALRESEKERAENVMIVDLMRNDLARIANKNSVVVEELFGLYSFSQVHQMISTISAQVVSQMSFADVLEATFPMGSMTGAPKKSAMTLIDRYETHRRELFSGSVGYIEPSGDFDFNVIIRSLQYNQDNHYAIAGVGSAITYLADLDTEYEECLWKLSTINKIVES